MNKDGSLYVQGLTATTVTEYAEVTNVLEKAGKNRSTGSHNFNEHSSRSHLVLTVYIKAKNYKTKEQFNSKMNLIDLAGSERVSKTDASGDRLKEAQNINKSLSALGDVINALSNKSKHIPYRNSKLTYLLQDSLSGNSKVLMFVNVSPANYNASETVCSLSFAERCRKTELGGALKNTNQSVEISRLKNLVENLQSQLKILPSPSPVTPAADGDEVSSTTSGTTPKTE